MEKNKNFERMTLAKLIEQKEKLMSGNEATAEVYVESLGATVVVKEIGVDLVADIENMPAIKANKHVLANCLVEPNIYDEELQKAFGSPTLKQDVLDLIFKTGEIAQLANICSNLAGYGSSAIEIVKN